MRKFFLVVLALLWASPAIAQIAVVQTATHQGAVGADVAITFALDTVVHHGVLVFIYWDNGPTLNSVDDDAASCSGYTHLAAADVGTNAQAYYCSDINASITSVMTAHFSGTPSHFSAMAYEISGQATSTPIDQTGTATPGSSTTPSGPAVVTTTSQTLAMAFIVCNNGSASVTGLHSGNTFTSDRIDNTVTHCTAIASKNVTSCVSSTAPQWDLDLADTTLAITVAWKQAGSSGCGGGGTYPGGIINTPIRCCGFDPPPLIRDDL